MTISLKQLIKHRLLNFYWTIYGSSLKNPHMPSSVKSVLFVCKGNVCRSPFAQYLAEQIAATEGGLETIFYSVGLEVLLSSPPPHQAIVTAEMFGVKLHKHKSRSINSIMVESFDMIIALDGWQFNTLRKTYTAFEEKGFLLPLFDDGRRTNQPPYFQYNIQDPYGKELEEFHSCFHRIQICIEQMFVKTKLLRNVKK